MLKFILGKKIGMSSFFLNDRQVPVTLIEAGPVKVVQVKTKEKDGYRAAQVGFLSQKPQRLTKAQRSHQKDLGGFKHLREFRLDGEEGFKEGDEINISVFNEGEKVEVSGISKSKGFQGVVKRHGFAGGPKTHGQKHCLRAPGSLGATTPQRVIKGRKMAGRTGGEMITLKKAKIAYLDAQNNLMAIKGAIPGRRGTLLKILAKVGNK